MTQDIDQQLAGELDKMEVEFPKPIHYRHMAASSLEENPLYVPYNNTDLRLWEKKDKKHLNKIPLQPKLLIKKPILQHNKFVTKSMSKQWLRANLKELPRNAGWVQVISVNRAKLNNIYGMKDLIAECDRIKEMHEMLYPQSYSSEVSDLIAHFDSCLHIPKQMSEMAKSMYG